MFKTITRKFKETVDSLREKAQKCGKVVVAAVGAVVSAVTATKSEAVITGVPADIWTAVDTTGMAVGVTTILVALIGISLVFLAYRYAKRSMRGA